MSFVVLKNLWIKYDDFFAVKRLNFEIEKGDIFGFIGPNGAGKSSTIKVLATLIQPTMGRAYVDKIDVMNYPNEVRRKIGYVPDYFGTYDDFNVNEYLHFFAAAFRLPAVQRQRTIDDVLELTDLTGKKESPVDGLSRGMKQRLSLARVLLHDPELLLLDEPASGLDPRARIEMRELLKELKAMGKTILISSHILSELSELCSSIGIIEKGRMVAQGNLTEIYETLNMQRKVHIQISNLDDEMLAKIKVLPGVTAVKEEVDRLAIDLQEGSVEVEDLHQSICGLGAKIRMFQAQVMDMESAFMKLTEGNVQ